ncbi:hypothetical protein EON80_10660 [bacterium]|nr:MAG: hypothetical protein EON80_10660 [bacterium]
MEMWGIIIVVLAVVALSTRLFRREPAPAPTGLLVEHFPNPTDLHTADLSFKPDFAYLWFYRTEVTNTLDEPLQILRFEAFFWVENRWVASNVLGRPLTDEVFTRWYGIEDGPNNGWLRPGVKAVCEVNWHGMPSPTCPRMKWVFYAQDERGNPYQGEGEVISVPYDETAALAP